MLGAQSTVTPVSGVGAVIEHGNGGRSTGNSLARLRASSFRCSAVIRSPKQLRLGLKIPVSVRCDSSSSSSSSRGGFGGRSGNGGDRDDGDYIEASLLLSETMSHYRMRRPGYREDSREKLFPFRFQKKDQDQRSQLRADVNFLGHAFLQRFQYPTIFLKISCDGDFLLPIVVGEFAIEKLIDAQFWGKENQGSSPDQFQFLRNFVDKLGYQVNMVQITERVVNTYFARLFFSKPGQSDVLTVDMRPSDAINIANRCKAPIYVNKQIVLTDAIRISYRMGRVHDAKSTYDVLLDSAVDGPDYLSQELHLIKDIDLAVKEERYEDAAMWKEKLLQLRNSLHEH